MNQIRIKTFVVMIERRKETDDILAQGKRDPACFQCPVGVNDVLRFRSDCRRDRL